MAEMAVTADKATTEDIHHTDCAVVYLRRRIEIKVKLMGVALGVLVGLHVLRKGRHAREEEC